MSYLLIIGAKSDLAMATARKYADHGYDLYLAARNPDELKEFAQDISVRTQRTVKLLELDIMDWETHQDFYAKIEEKPRGVLVAVGYLGEQKHAQNDFNEARKIIDTNYTGVVSLLNIVALDFEHRKTGFIIGISSVAGDRGRKSNYLYGSAKAALTTYFSGLRNRLNDSYVQVLTVKPGFLNTKMTAGMDLPERLTAKPEEAAEDIFQAQQKGKNIIYTKWIWRWIMAVIKLIPEWLFKKLSI